MSFTCAGPELYLGQGSDVVVLPGGPPHEHVHLSCKPERLWSTVVWECHSLLASAMQCLEL